MITCVCVIQAVMALHGSVSCAIVDLESGLRIVRSGDDTAANLSLTGTIYARLLRAKLRLVQEQCQNERMEDLMVTLEKHYHLIRPLQSMNDDPHIFLYLVMDRERTNLPLTRRKLAEMSEMLSLQPGHLRMRPECSDTASRGTCDGMLAPVTNYPAAYAGRVTKTADIGQEELPAFMRDDDVMRMLGLSASAHDAPRC